MSILLNVYDNIDQFNKIVRMNNRKKCAIIIIPLIVE